MIGFVRIRSCVGIRSLHVQVLHVPPMPKDSVIRVVVGVVESGGDDRSAVGHWAVR